MENNESQSSKLPVAPEQIDSAQIDSTQIDSAQIDSAQIDSAQIDSEQIDSAQIDSAENSEQSDSTLKKERTYSLPKIFLKNYTPEQVEKKLVKKLYLPQDKQIVRNLFTTLAADPDHKFSKKEIKIYKKLAKEIKKQNKGYLKFIPLIAVIAAIIALVAVVAAFKNTWTRKAIKSSCEAVFGAKTDVGYVNLSLFKANLTVKNIAVGNKNDFFKNLFEARNITVDFDLNQLLRGKFVAENLDLTEFLVNTDRTTSCELIEKKLKQQQKQEALEKKKAQFMNSLEQVKDDSIAQIKNKASQLLGGTNVEEIAATLQNELKTPGLVKTVTSQAEEMKLRWESTPASLTSQVKEFSDSVSALAQTDISKITDKKVLAKTLNQIIDALYAEEKLEKNIKKITGDLKNDVQTIKQCQSDILEAVEHDKNYASEKLTSIAGAVSESKVLIENSFNTLACAFLGKYYTYILTAIEYSNKLKEASNTEAARKAEKIIKSLKDTGSSLPDGTKIIKKETKKAGERRLKGTTYWYGMDSAKFLIQKAHATGQGFDAEIREITTDQNIRNLPLSFNGTLNKGEINHSAKAIIDARKLSHEPLLTMGYHGKGFDTVFDGRTIAEKCGIPSVNGISNISAELTGSSEGFAIRGSFNLKNATVQSDGFENEFVTKYYNVALGSIKNVDVNYSVKYDPSFGIIIDLDGDFKNIFADAMKSTITTIGGDAKKAAVTKINEELNNSSNEVIAKIKEFLEIKGQIDIQNADLQIIKKTLELKKRETEEKIDLISKKATLNALNKLLGDEVDDETKEKISSGAVNKVKKTLD